MASPLQNVSVYICSRAVFFMGGRGWRAFASRPQLSWLCLTKKLWLPYLVNFL